MLRICMLGSQKDQSHQFAPDKICSAKHKLIGQSTTSFCSLKIKTGHLFLFNKCITADMGGEMEWLSFSAQIT